MDVVLYYVALAIATVVVMTVMGFTKALISYMLGDKAIKNMGKVSLNPKRHFEIIGFIIFVFFGYGWTAPVDTSSLYYKNRKRDSLIVSILPLLLAIVFAFISYILFGVLVKLGAPVFIRDIFNYIGLFFVNFAVFNIIPIYPLFGQKIFQTLLPTNKALMLSQYEKIFQLVIIFLLLSGILQDILSIVSSFIIVLISTPINLILGSI